MTYIMHFQHGSRLSWNRDFLKLDDKTGEVSSVRLNLLQRILRLTLGSLASSRGINAFYARTIFSQKRITPFEQTRNSAVAAKIETLVCTLNCCGKKLSFRAPHLDPYDHSPIPINLENVQAEDEQAQDVVKMRDFFPTPIPKDMAVLLLSWLDFKDVVRMKQVNQTWHQLITGITKSLAKRFADSCYEEATKDLVNTPADGRNQGTIFRGFMNLLKSLVKYDLEATMKTVAIAKQKASKLDKQFRDYLLREIAKVEAVYDLASAKETAATITEDSDRNAANFHIALYIEKNFSRAKDLALAQGGIVGAFSFLEIAQVEAETDIPAAQETLRSIQDRDVQNKAKIEIIKRLAITDLPAAKRLTAELENPRFRYKAELALAQLDSQPNFQPVIATALTIVDGEDQEQQQALADIAIIQNKFDKNGAQKTLALMKQDSFQRNWPNFKLAELEAQHNWSAAIQNVVWTANNYRFQMILLKHMASKNMWEAKTTAHSFQDLEERVIALKELAEFALKKDKDR